MSFYEYLAYIRNIMGMKWCKYKYKNLPLPCPDNLFIDVIYKVSGDKLMSKISRDGQYQTFDPRGCTTYSPINFGSRSHPLTDNYSRVVGNILPDDLPNRFKDLTHLTNKDLLVVRYNNITHPPRIYMDGMKLNDGDEITEGKYISLGLEMHVLSAIATLKYTRDQALFFRKVKATGDIMESRFFKELLTDDGFIKINSIISNGWGQISSLINSNWDKCTRVSVSCDIKPLILNVDKLMEIYGDDFFTNTIFSQYKDQSGRYNNIESEILDFHKQIPNTYGPKYCQETESLLFENTLNEDNQFNNFLKKAWDFTKDDKILQGYIGYNIGGRYPKDVSKPKKSRSMNSKSKKLL